MDELSGVLVRVPRRWWPSPAFDPADRMFVYHETTAALFCLPERDSVFVFSTDADRITAIRVIRNPDKLAWLAAHGGLGDTVSQEPR